jgi:CBS domain-containing protein
MPERKLRPDLESAMRARDVMTRTPVTVRPETPVREAAALLAEHRITSMPVVDDGGRVVGIVSEVDVLRDRMPHDPRSSVAMSEDGPDPADTVGQIMTDAVVCVPDFADMADVAAAMVESHLRAVPILSGGDLVGIVSRRDVLRTLLRDDTAIEADARERLTEYDPDASWHVSVTDGVVTVSAHLADERAERLVDALLRTVPGAVRVHVHSARFAR